MKKYPECCYRIGNEFDSQGFSFMLCCFDASEGGNAIIDVASDDEYIQYIENFELWNAELTSITAETLAELARENGEVVDWHDGYKEICIYKLGEDYGYARPILQVKQGEDEPLGEFFLRVAKERKYIK